MLGLTQRLRGRAQPSGRWRRGQRPALVLRVTAPFVERRFAVAFLGPEFRQRPVVRRQHLGQRGLLAQVEAPTKLKPMGTWAAKRAAPGGPLAHPCAEQKKRPTVVGLFGINPGGDLLSHGEAPHYHRRCTVSLLSSAWIQVVPVLYCRQENWCSGACALRTPELEFGDDRIGITGTRCQRPKCLGVIWSSRTVN